jgi:hypothetical protein
VNVTVTDGSVVIRWPAMHEGGLRGWAVEVLDAETGEPLVNVARGRVIVLLDPDNVVRADLEQFAGHDGQPSTTPVFDDLGEPVTGMFRYQVARMETPHAGVSIDSIRNKEIYAPLEDEE